MHNFTFLDIKFHSAFDVELHNGAKSGSLFSIAVLVEVSGAWHALLCESYVSDVMRSL